MYCFTRTETDPAFNLAAEEYLLKNADEDCFMLWRNHKAIIVGRNQNTLSEINPDFVDRHGIRVVRRITGGGASTMTWEMSISPSSRPTAEKKRSTLPPIPVRSSTISTPWPYRPNSTAATILSLRA